MYLALPYASCMHSLIMVYSSNQSLVHYLARALDDAPTRFVGFMLMAWWP